MTETSLVVQWLSKDFGRLATVAKGGRRTKSQFRGKIDLFYVASFSFQRSSRSDLHNLREVSLENSNPQIREDLRFVEQASYAARLVETATERETPLPEVFALMNGFLAYLPGQPPVPTSVFALELKLLSELGLAPPIESALLSAGSRQFMAALVTMPWELIPRLRPAAAQGREIGQFLQRFLLYHLGKVPLGRDAAVQMPEP